MRLQEVVQHTHQEVLVEEMLVDHKRQHLAVEVVVELVLLLEAMVLQTLAVVVEVLEMKLVAQMVVMVDQVL